MQMECELRCFKESKQRKTDLCWECADYRSSKNIPHGSSEGEKDQRREPAHQQVLQSARRPSPRVCAVQGPVGGLGVAPRPPLPAGDPAGGPVSPPLQVRGLQLLLVTLLEHEVNSSHEDLAGAHHTVDAPLQGQSWVITLLFSV